MELESIEEIGWESHVAIIEIMVLILLLYTFRIGGGFGTSCCG